MAVTGLAIGCGGSDGDSGAAASSTTHATVVADSTSESTTPESTEAPVTTSRVADPPATTQAPTTTAPGPDDGDCLVGDWVVTQDEMNGYYDSLMSTMDAPLTIDVVGSAPLSFAADGTYGWAPDFALAVEIMGQRGTGDTGGTINGNWTADDGVVTTASDVNALTVSISVGGVTMAGDDFANGLLNSSPINGVTYSCDGPTPVLDFMTGDDAVTVPVTLTPA